MTGVSFVVPVRNGGALLEQTIETIVAQADGRRLEIIIVVDDASADDSFRVATHVAARFETVVPTRVVHQRSRGAAASINEGVRTARYPLIAQVDQDLRLHPGWMRELTEGLRDPDVAAAQGVYVTDPGAQVCARVMSLDLEQRYAGIEGETDHVCTGNSIYRAEALRRAGPFDESMGYGYDNDMSYRLGAAGYRLALCPGARSYHHWREGLAGYLRQQYGFGYGRLDVLVRHRDRLGGDAVSPLPMMLHPVVMLAALCALSASVVLSAAGRAAPFLLWTSAALVAALSCERLAVGARAARRFGDRAAWLFPVLHLLRDGAWVAAIAIWVSRRITRRGSLPSDSMWPRHARLRLPMPSTPRIVAIIPVHNEAANIRSVVLDLASERPDVEVLVVNDGSTDETAAVLDELRVRSIAFSERMGIGSAMRAGLRYARRLGFDAAIRLDGDGQHSAADIDALLAPICEGRAEVVMGTRYSGGSAAARGHLLRTTLATCLSALTGRRITDPTSGFGAFGPEAVRLLADHHPDGYGEPELRLFLSRNGLRAVEVPVRSRSRLNGRTSLTLLRLVLAAAHVLLALIIVPLRPVVKQP